MSVNKVIFDDETLIDLTSDTVTPETMLSGVTATSASGEKITGTLVPVTSINGQTGDVTLSLSSFGVKATAEELNKLDGVTATATELNYVDGVTSNIQTQLNAKAASSALSSYLPLSGGDLTGNLSGKYLTGTWLRTTSTSDLGKAATKIAVLDSSGWVYYRTAEEIKSDIGAAGKSTIVSATLLAKSWSSESYTLSVSGVTTTSNQEILPDTSITAAQLKALQAANIQDGGQASGSLTLKAFGTVPTIDIPIRVIVRGDA